VSFRCVQETLQQIPSFIKKTGGQYPSANELAFKCLVLHECLRLTVFNLHSRNLCDGGHAVDQLVEALRTRL